MINPFKEYRSLAVFEDYRELIVKVTVLTENDTDGSYAYSFPSIDILESPVSELIPSIFTSTLYDSYQYNDIPVRDSSPSLMEMLIG